MTSPNALTSRMSVNDISPLRALQSGEPEREWKGVSFRRSSVRPGLCVGVCSCGLFYVIVIYINVSAQSCSLALVCSGLFATFPWMISFLCSSASWPRSFTSELVPRAAEAAQTTHWVTQHINSDMQLKKYTYPGLMTSGQSDWNCQL